MTDQYARTRLLIGTEKMERLGKSRVAVFGLGGVGGHCAEALARSGIGTLDLIDSDVVSLSNLNRQIFATHAVIGMPKVDAAAARLREICPDLVLHLHRCFFLPENADRIDFSAFDFVVDAIDTVTGKLAIVEKAREAGVPLISCMGTGNRTDPSALRIADISETHTCALARIMRRELRRRGTEHLTVVWSEEEPLAPEVSEEEPSPGRRSIPGSNAFVPPAAGLLAASYVIRRLTD